MDDSHIMALALGPTTDAISSYKQHAWGGLSMMINEEGEEDEEEDEDGEADGMDDDIHGAQNGEDKQIENMANNGLHTQMSPLRSTSFATLFHPHPPPGPAHDAAKSMSHPSKRPIPPLQMKTVDGLLPSASSSSSQFCY